MSRKNKAAKKAAKQAESAAHQAANFIQPYVSVAEDRVGSAAKYAADRSKDLADKAKDNFADALDRVGPVVDDARHRVNDEVVPKLKDLLDQATESDAVKTASKRGAAAVASLKGELELPQSKKKGGKGRKVAKVLAITAVLAGAVVAVRKFLTSKDADWTAHEPTTAPSSTPTPRAETLLKPKDGASTAGTAATDTTAASRPKAATDQGTDHPDATAAANRPGADSPAADEAAATSAPKLAEEAEKQQVDGKDPKSPGEVADDSAPKGGPAQYGEGSWAGENPPAGFTIKGNERSMKYHVPTSGGYDRTIADVWFDSEERATKAGFSRAQR